MRPKLASMMKVLIGFNCLFIAVYLLDKWLQLRISVINQLTNLDAEGTIPAWYSSGLLLVTGLVLILAGYRAQIKELLWARFIKIVGLGFVFLSADETAAIHEKVTQVLKHFDSLPRFNGDHGMWIPVYLGIALVFLAITRKSWLNLWKTQKYGARFCVIGASLFVGGAVGLEILSYGDLRGEGPVSFLYYLQVAAEEGLEMFGATLILMGSARIYYNLLETPVLPGRLDAASTGASFEESAKLHEFAVDVDQSVGTPRVKKSDKINK